MTDNSPAQGLEATIIGDIKDASTIFIDGAQGISVTNDVAKINLFQVIQDVTEPDAPMRRVIVARLAMSPTTLGQLTLWLAENVKVKQKNE